ncbi:SspB family protein [Chelativorans alearense]|uniref:SspB family protein n=1 Tax=Chelativorans alearense TaxID=2681495 RepID=UPI0013D6509F|nr:SspB family protein [Chelativorans alearense]
MPDDRIRYDILVQEAARGVMRKVLQETARAGLPGNHHFFITFMTGAPGVRISSRLKERYPEQMTIVIQYQYWDLKVSEKGFEVVLSFADTPEKLEVPFSAVRGFYDPSANFEMEFDDMKPDAEPEAEPEEAASDGKAQPRSVVKSKSPAKSTASKSKEKPEKAEKDEAKGADVVSLDAFRKK